VLAGFAEGAVRLEAVAPFGSPAFILTADRSSGTLLLLRDRRLLQNAPPAGILDALIGIPLGPDDLLAVLSGCVKASAQAIGGREFGPDWLAIDLAGGGEIFLRREAAVWRIVAGRHSGLEIEYREHRTLGGLAGELPARVRIRSISGGTTGVELSVDLNQVEINGKLTAGQLTAVTIPPGLSSISLEELREAGPLGAPD
jgi:hypothetical protein